MGREYGTIETLDKARYVRYDEKNDYVLIWYGGTYIHVFTSKWNAISVWSMNSKGDNPTLDEVIQSMEYHMSEKYYP